ncbi:serine protease [Streptomyces sp. cg36]|uniref:trypsin-like serine peptidase n=1 Tax=Streptomyces sp. cg36 TaxID=3238798 RepID=UPI0034E1986D
MAAWLLVAVVAGLAAFTATRHSLERQDSRAVGAADPVGARRDVPSGAPGGRRDWSVDRWLRDAADFVNPVIDGLWGPARMAGATGGERSYDGSSMPRGVSDPEPAPVAAQPVGRPYAEHAPAAGRLFFDTPKGPAACSGTVVRDPAHPGRSDLVWTAGHCVHAGKDGGWLRDIVFVPGFDKGGREAAGAARRVAPLGIWWADWAQTAQQWIDRGTAGAGPGAAFDFAVVHVRRAAGATRSLEETVGAAVDVAFDTGAGGTAGVGPGSRVDIVGYPAGRPFDGSSLFECTGRPGSFSVAADQPNMYRMGCTMTEGSSGGGWLVRRADGGLVLVSNTSLGSRPAAWLAGPHLGADAQRVLADVSRRFADSG